MKYRLSPICWSVLVYCKGHFAGTYDYPTRVQAEQHAALSHQKMGVIGCRYIVKPRLRLERVA
jgi:hypothetical protein